MFFFLGRPLLGRLGPAGAAMLAAAAGSVRWAIMAETAWLPAMAAIEPLHGLTFALLHLTCLRLLAQAFRITLPRHTIEVPAVHHSAERIVRGGSTTRYRRC